MSHVRRSFVAVLVCSGLAVGLSARPALAQGSPWIAEPGTGSISITYANQNATEYFSRTTRTTGAIGEGGKLRQNTVWIGVNYALHDALSLDVQTGWAQSYIKGAVGPSGGQEGYSGLYDSNVALTWRIVDELISDAPSVALRVGAIVGGGYDTGYINALGDGGNGVETSVLVGKFWDALGFSGEFGYRVRTSTEVNPMAIGATMGMAETVDIPNDVFLNLGLFVPAGSRVTLGMDYRMVNGQSGLQLGGEGFSPSRFPGVEEDAHLVGGRVIVNLTEYVSVNGFYGQVVRGRNTARSRIFGAGLSYGFGGSF